MPFNISLFIVQTDRHDLHGIFIQRLKFMYVSRVCKEEVFAYDRYNSLTICLHYLFIAQALFHTYIHTYIRAARCQLIGRTKGT